MHHGIFINAIMDDSLFFQAKAVELGKIKVNGQPVDKDYKLKHNDLIENTLHRLVRYCFFFLIKVKSLNKLHFPTYEYNAHC